VSDQLDPAAQVYAEALHQAAVEGGRVEAADQTLERLVKTLSANPDLTAALANPRLPAEAKLRIADGLMRDGEPLARNAVAVLIRNGRLGLLIEMQSAYAELAAATEQILDVEVTTAVPIGEDQLELLRSRIAAAVGGTPRLSTTVDPDILGGLVLRARGVLVDDSVRRHLQDLRQALIRVPLPVGSEA
jgi:F-type H+-transporting ATPase subunit delta